MSSSVNSAKFECSLQATVSSGSGAKYAMSKTFENNLLSGGTFIFDRVFALNDYSLTTAAGNLDIDLYDLGALDVGAGAGSDNLGLSHANARIVAFCIENTTLASGGTLRVDNNGATNPWTGIFGSTRVLDLPQGAFVCAYLGENGKTVTDASDHILRLSAQTADCTVNLRVFSKQS